MLALWLLCFCILLKCFFMNTFLSAGPQALDTYLQFDVKHHNAKVTGSLQGNVKLSVQNDDEPPP